MKKNKLSKRDILRKLCFDNARYYEYHNDNGNRYYETADLFTGADLRRHKSVNDAIEWEKGYKR